MQIVKRSLLGSKDEPDLRVPAVDLLQPKQFVRGAVARVEVVLDHLGGPLGGVVVGVQLTCRHHILLRCRCFFLCTERERKCKLLMDFDPLGARWVGLLSSAWTRLQRRVESRTNLREQKGGIKELLAWAAVLKV